MLTALILSLLLQAGCLGSNGGGVEHQELKDFNKTWVDGVIDEVWYTDYLPIMTRKAKKYTLSLVTPILTIRSSCELYIGATPIQSDTEGDSLLGYDDIVCLGNCAGISGMHHSTFIGRPCGEHSNWPKDIVMPDNEDPNAFWASCGRARCEAAGWQWIGANAWGLCKVK